jgi:hypothetical protein
MLNELIWPTLLHCVKEAICAFEANGNKIICIEGKYQENIHLNGLQRQ